MPPKMKIVEDIIPNHKIGRPSKNKNGSLNKTITIKVTESEKALYTMVAEIKGISVSELVRITMSDSHKKLDKFVGNLKELNIKTG